MPILVAGASKPLGAEIALALAASGHRVIATRRKPSPQDQRLLSAGITLETMDLTDLVSVRRIGQRVSRAVLVPILSVSAPAAQVLARAGVERGVVFSSNNVAIVGADPVYGALRAAEADVLAGAPGWAMLRPTMIYGYRGDGTLSRLLGWLKRYPVVPFPGSGRALQQPLFMHDLASGAAQLAAGHDTITGVLPLGGPDVLAYRDLLDLAKGAVGSRALIVPVPLALIRPVNGAARLTGLRLVSPAQLARIELDKAVPEPRGLPEAIVPRTGVREGLARLAEAMGLTPRYR